MQFIVIGRDGKDDKALERRMASREVHLETARAMHASGNWLYAAAILNDEGNMAGSMIVCDFEDEAALKSQWLDNEAYVTGNVWETVEIRRAAVAPFWAPE
jgi:uncharacterized protein YciI